MVLMQNVCSSVKLHCLFCPGATDEVTGVRGKRGDIIFVIPFLPILNIIQGTFFWWTITVLHSVALGAYLSVVILLLRATVAVLLFSTVGAMSTVTYTRTLFWRFVSPKFFVFSVDDGTVQHQFLVNSILNTRDTYDITHGSWRSNLYTQIQETMVLITFATILTLK